MDINDMLATPESDEPPMNAAIEQCLAMSGYNKASRKMTLQAWMMIGAEYLAREIGRKRALEVIEDVKYHVRNARPSKPWPE